MSMAMTCKSALGDCRQHLDETNAVERYLRFGRFQVDLERGELFKEGSRVHVPFKVFQVLVALVERPGEIVTRQTLRARLWPDGTFVNYDTNVNTAVNKLRRILEDSPENPLWVETIPRQGDCFLGHVEHGDELCKSPPVMTTEPVDQVHDLVAQQEAPSIFARKRISGGFVELLTNGWSAGILLCGVLIGVVLVLLTHRRS